MYIRFENARRYSPVTGHRGGLDSLARLIAQSRSASVNVFLPVEAAISEDSGEKMKVLVIAPDGTHRKDHRGTVARMQGPPGSPRYV